MGRLCGVGSRGYCSSAESGQGLRGPGGGAGDGAALPTNTELSECSDTRWLVQVYRLNPSSEQGEGPPRLTPGWSWRNLSMFWGGSTFLAPSGLQLTTDWTCLLTVFSEKTLLFPFFQALEKATWGPAECIQDRSIRAPRAQVWGPGCSPVEVPHHVALHLGRRAPQHHRLRPGPLALTAWLPLDVGVPQSCADVVEEPGQWAQLQEGFLEWGGYYPGANSPALRGPQRVQVEGV